MQITPTIFIGLGSTGTAIVAEIAREVFAASKDQTLHGLIRYFAIETAAISGLRSVHHLPSSIETFGIAEKNLLETKVSLVGTEGDETLDAWYGRGAADAIKESQNMTPAETGAGCKRVIGRMMFDASYESDSDRGAAGFQRRLGAVWNELHEPKTAQTAKNRFSNREAGSSWANADVQIGSKPQVVVIMSPCGGTGGGIVGQVAWMVRKLTPGVGPFCSFVAMPPSDFAAGGGDTAKKVGVSHNTVSVLEDMFFRWTATGTDVAVPPENGGPMPPNAKTRAPTLWAGGSDLYPWFDCTILASPELASGQKIGDPSNLEPPLHTFMGRAVLRISMADISSELVNQATDRSRKLLAMGMVMQQHPVLEIAEAAAYSLSRTVIMETWLAPVPKKYPPNRDTNWAFSRIIREVLRVLKESISRQIDQSNGNWFDLVLDDENQQQLVLQCLKGPALKLDLEGAIQKAVADVLAAQLSGRSLAQGSGFKTTSFRSTEALLARLLKKLDSERRLNWAPDDTYDLKEALYNIQASRDSLLGFGSILCNLVVKDEYEHELETTILNALLGMRVVNSTLVKVIESCRQANSRIISRLESFKNDLTENPPRDLLNTEYLYSNQASPFEPAWRHLAQSVSTPRPAPVRAAPSSGHAAPDYIKLRSYGVAEFDWKTNENLVGALGFWFGSSLGQAFTAAPLSFDGKEADRQNKALLLALAEWSWAQIVMQLDHIPVPELDVMAGRNGTEVPMSLRTRSDIDGNLKPKRDNSLLYRIRKDQPASDGPWNLVANPLFQHSDALIQLYYNIEPRRLGLVKSLEDQGFGPRHGDAVYDVLRYPYDRPSFMEQRGREEAVRVAHLIFVAVDFMSLGGKLSPTAVLSDFAAFVRVEGDELIVFDEFKLPKQFSGQFLAEALTNRVANHANPRTLMTRLEDEWVKVRRVTKLQGNIEAAVTEADGTAVAEEWQAAVSSSGPGRRIFTEGVAHTTSVVDQALRG